MTESSGYSAIWQLREVSTQVRSLGYLLKTHSLEEDGEADVAAYRGIGALLMGFGERIQELANDVENQHLKQVRRGVQDERPT